MYPTKGQRSLKAETEPFTFLISAGRQCTKGKH